MSTVPAPASATCSTAICTLDATYRFTKRDSDDNDVEFDRNIVLVGFTARL